MNIKVWMLFALCGILAGCKNGFDSLESTTTTSTNSATTTTVPGASAIPNALVNPNIGGNIEGLADWSRARMYVDAMRVSRHWGSTSAPWDEAAAVDANGWPTGDAGVVIAMSWPSDTEPMIHYLSEGVYKLKFIGKATVSSVASNLTVQNNVYDSVTNTSTADVVLPADAGQIILSFTNTNGGVKNVELIRPGYAGSGKIFTDEFIASLAPFSTLRFMDYLATNGNPVANWSDRTTRASATYAGAKGGPWEDIIALANQTGKDIWINIPAQATDDYVLQLVTLLKKTLNPNIRIYFEYSNEVWNWSFSQATYNLNQAQAEAAAGDTSLTWGATCTQADFDAGNVEACNKYWAAYLRIPKRLIQISKIFAQVYGNAAINSQIRPVLASQFGYKAVEERQLAYINDTFGPPANFIYAIAGAPYFAITQASAQSTTLTVDQIISEYSNYIQTNDYSGFREGTAYNGGRWTNANQLALARYYGIKSLAYEGGNDYFQYDASIAAKVASNFDPRMYDLMKMYYSQWFGCGHGLFMHFTISGGFGRWGSWGLTNEITNLSTPKYNAIRDLSQTPMSSFTSCQ